MCATTRSAALAACCGFDLCHKYILYLYLYLYLYFSGARSQGHATCVCSAGSARLAYHARANRKKRRYVVTNNANTAGGLHTHRRKYGAVEYKYKYKIYL